jgi:type IV pilus assembly protein PilB
MLQTKPDPLQKKLLEIRREAEERDAERRAARLGLAYANLAKVPISVEAVAIIPEAEAKEAKLAAVELKAKDLALAVYDPNLPAAEKVIQKLKDKGYNLKIFVSSLSSLEQPWQLYKYIAKEAKEITGKVEIEKKHLEDLLLKLTNIDALRQEMERILRGRATTTALLETLLAGALSNRASDIHLEAEEKKTRVRLRLDGALHDVLDTLPPKDYERLVTRIKLLAGLKINIHGEPQDGRFTVDLPQKDIEIRVSIIPSEFGETIVMRILDPDAIRVDLPQLGLRPDDLAIVERILKEPNGLILNTGPTGSGKTTTLYAFLRYLNDPEIKIITIEDPIEYRIEGIEQTQTDPEVGYTFASGLRSIMRQDPDVILVGEIRDSETADIALQASLTGHLVLSTLHTNDAIGAVPRLLDLGAKPQTVGPALSLIIAQRLVRKLCPKCKKEVELTPDLRNKINSFLEKLPPRVDKSGYHNPVLYAPVGCVECSGIGYRGRIGIFEFLEGGPELEELILKDASQVALTQLARKQGIVFLQQDGILKVLSGITDLEEVERITGPITWNLEA